MNSNDHSSFYNRQPRLPHSSHPPRPFVQEDTLKTEMIQIERKAFVLTLKENLRGRFLRITEAVGEKRSTIDAVWWWVPSSLVKPQTTSAS